MGLAAGSLNGAVLNTLAVIKYHGWGNGDGTFLQASRDIYQRGGLKAFFKGVRATVARDAIFGVAYEVVRGTLKSEFHIHADSNDHWSTANFLCDATAAAVGTVVSGPFNYVRNVVYATPPDVRPPSNIQALRGLWQETMAHRHPGQFLHDRLRLGWGTARVAVGMGIGQFIYGWIKILLVQTPLV